MKQYSFYALMIFAVMAMLVIGGCSKNSPTGLEDENLDQIDQEYGGYTTSNESPDEFLVNEYTDEDEDQAVEDGISELPDVNSLFDSTSMDIYYVRVTWGNLEWDSTATVITDWSGSASINKGTLAVLRTIRFEHRTDYIKHRNDRKSVAWASKTMPHFDGILFAIIDNDTSDTEGEFTINAGTYSNTFTFSELDSMELVEEVDDLGNQISIVSFNRKVVPFAGGFLEGRWIRDKKHGGHFVGRWVHSTGLRAGHMRGIWGVDRSGDKVLYGKYVSVSGIFKGLLKGTWGYEDADENNGWFAGRWVNARFTEVGGFKGHWKIGEPGDRKGYFRGKWFHDE